jgi:hypothetical protein
MVAPDLVSRADEQRWADLISQGIGNIEKLLGLAFGRSLRTHR